MRYKRLPAYTFTVEFPAPLDIPASLEIFRRTGDDGIDRWDGRVLVRTTRVADTMSAHRHGCWHSLTPRLEVTVAHATQAPAVEHTAHNVCDSAGAAGRAYRH